MSSLIALFSIFILCGSVSCDIIKTTIKPQSAMISKENDSHPLEKETPGSNLLLKQLKLINIKNTEKLEDNKIEKNTMETLNKRKSKFLGSLAFLAGLGFGGLANAASSTVKAYAKFPQASIAMNFVPSKQGPYLAAYYDPYPFVHHPYLYQSPLGFYPFVDPSKLQSLTGGSSQQSGFDRPTQIITLFDDKRPSDSDDSEEEYIVEKTKADKSKSSNRPENLAETTESRIDIVDEQTEGEMTNRVVTCGTRNKLEEEAADLSNRDSMMYDLGDLQEDADDSKAIMNRVKTQANNSTTFRPPTRPTARPTSRPTARPTNRPTPMPTPMPTPPTPIPTPTPNPRPTTTDLPTNENLTMDGNITSSPFFGYYGGNPQDIEHIDFISDMQPPIYHEPNPINYHLPYERPANFYPEEKYHFYSNSFPNSYPSGPFFSEHMTDYSRNDFNQFVYPSDNNYPPYTNQFKPLTYS
ncbi:hypothetical protein M0802_009212 [Mischocyttarus mexicanus]|nr:hypothetical protein M0802_009212 [Mischocyttarus mexicanus]